MFIIQITTLTMTDNKKNILNLIDSTLAILF